MRGVELDALVLIKDAVSLAGDSGVVNEDVLAAVIGGDEAEALPPLNHLTVPCDMLNGPSGPQDPYPSYPGARGSLASLSSSAGPV